MAILLVICFVSGGYALYLNETGLDVSSDVGQQTTSPQSNISHPNNPETGVEKVVNIDNVKPVFEYISSYSNVLPTHTILAAPGFNTTGYHVFNTEYQSFYVKDDLNTSDKYSQCAECGKYIPIGSVSKALPDNLICHGHEDSFGSNIDDDYFALTYDEVLFCVDHNGYLPESAYTRINEHLGITRPYADYFSGYLYPQEPLHLGNPVTEQVVLPYIPVEDNSNSDEVVQHDVDVNPIDTVVYT